MRNSILILCLLTCFAGCSKSDHAFIPVEPAIRAFYDYKVGSYWIMQDSLSGRIDSFLVYDYNTGRYYNDDGDEEYIEMDILETSGASPTDSSFWAINLNHKAEVHFVYSDRSEYAYFANFPTRDLFSYTLNSKTYDSCVANTIVYQSGAPQSSNATATIVMNRADGIIYLKATIGSYVRVWKLIRSHIVH